MKAPTWTEYPILARLEESGGELLIRAAIASVRADGGAGLADHGEQPASMATVSSSGRRRRDRGVRDEGMGSPA